MISAHHLKMAEQLLLLVAAFAITTSSAFAPQQTCFTRQPYHVNNPLLMTLDESSPSSPSTANTLDDINKDDWYYQWAVSNGVEMDPKIAIRTPLEEERGKGGILATDDVKALEVLAKIPRSLILSAVDAPPRAIEAAANANNFSWATDLTSAALVALHPTDEELLVEDAAKAKQQFVQSWQAGGWATDGADLGPPDVNFGAKDVTGSLLATGSDNDHNIYSKFRMPCHPVLFRASNGLSVLTGCTEEQAREVLAARGRMYRSMRDALEGLVLSPTERTKGSNREKRCWDVADLLSRVLSRATFLNLNDDDDHIPQAVIVPLHERLAHSSTENCKLVAASENEIWLVATQDIPAGEGLTRNYDAAPRLEQDESEGALHLLTQFGLPPSAW